MGYLEHFRDSKEVPRFDDDLNAELKHYMFKVASVLRNTIVAKCSINHAISSKNLKEIEKMLESNPPRICHPFLVRKHTSPEGSVHTCGTWFYIWDNSFFKLDVGRNSEINGFSSYSIDGENNDIFDSILDTFHFKETPGEISVVIPTRQGLTTGSLGIAGVKFNELNYRPEVVTGFKDIVKDLYKQDPLGRLIIIDGPPGTGKTYLVRSLLNECPNCKFIILPSSAAAALSGPEMLELLMNESGNGNGSRDIPDPGASDGEKSNKNRPLVLIIEDADACLSRRASDNISAISSILNLSDGIIGNLLDLRIICTTNVEIEQIDDALLRDGRLSARIEVGKLDAEQAQKVYKEAGGTEDVKFTEKFYTLGQIYALTKKKEEKPVEKKEVRKVGFQV